MAEQDQPKLDWTKEFDFESEWLKVDLEEEILRRFIAAEELDHLLRQHAYLVISDPDVEEPGQKPATLIKADSGWMIHDHGDLLRASSGKHAFGERKEDEDDGGEGSSKPEGSIVGQYIATAEQMIHLACLRWPQAAKVIEGYHGMQFAAFVAALERNYYLENFIPNAEQAEAYKRLCDAKGVKPRDVKPRIR